MRKTISLLALLLLSTPVALAQENGSSSERLPVGSVVYLKGRGRISAGPNGPSRELRNGDILHEQDELLCEEGLVKIRLVGRENEIAITPDVGVYPIPRLKSLVGERVAARLATRRRFKRAGRRRGSSGIVTSPQQGGVVLPSKLVFRWTPFEKNSRLSLSLQRAGSNKILWSETDVDGTAGELTDEKARGALKNIQKKTPGAEIEFTLTSQNHRPYSITFRVLSGADEKALTGELARWGQATDFMRNMGRADAYTRRQLYDEAAAEYEQALKDSPDSLDLLRATIRAYCQAGNKSHAQELAKRLPPGYLSPRENCLSAPPK
jgi:hypothetical protein